MKCRFISIVLLLSLAGCSVGYHDYIKVQNKFIGTVKTHKEPYKFPNSGELIRADYLIAGQGLTHITKDSEGNLIYHYSDAEFLPNYHEKEWVGKCLIYEVVDPNTYVVKSWGFDEGGNPLSCRTWP